jgi:hypothetical protein
MNRAGFTKPIARGLAAFATAGILAFALLGLSAAAVLAGPESGVDVVVHDGDTEAIAPGDPPTACTFHLHFTAGTAITGGYQIRPGTEDAAPVVEGEFDTTSGDSRAPASGVFQLDPGTYVITWDDELEQDTSFDQQTVEVACEAVVPPPPPPSQPTPTPTGTEQPGGGTAPTPTGTEQPGGGAAPTPTGGELPAGGVGGVTVTPPATDTAAATAPADSSAAALPVAALAVLAGLLLAWTMRLSHVVERRRNGRH